MKRIRDSSSELIQDTPSLLDVNTPTHPLHGDKFPLWPDLLPEMQGCVAEFLDNGTRQTLGQTCKQAYARWHVDTSSGRDAVIKLLAKDAPLDYVRPFITRVKRTIPIEMMYRVCDRMVTKLVKWGRWYENDIVEFILSVVSDEPFVAQDDVTKIAVKAAIRYSDMTCLDWLFKRGFMNSLSMRNLISNIYDLCGRYGNLQALKYFIPRIKEMGYDAIGFTPFWFHWIVVANLESKPRYAFDWPIFFEEIPTQYHVPLADEDWGQWLSRCLHLTPDYNHVAFRRISNCYAFWHHLGPRPRERMRGIWDNIRERIPYVTSIDYLFGDKEYLFHHDEQKDTLSHVQIETFLNMAEEMGFVSPFGSRYKNSNTIFCMLSLVMETKSDLNNEALCQWFIKRGSFDVPDVSDTVWTRIRRWFSMSLREPFFSKDIILYIRDWFVNHAFKGSSLLVDILDDHIDRSAHVVDLT